MGVWSIKLSRGGAELLCGCSDHRIALYDIAQRRVSASVALAHGDDVNSVCYCDAACNLIASGGDDAMLKLWDRREMGRDSRPAGVLVGHTEGLTHVASRGDGVHLVSNAKDQTAKLWDVRRLRSAGDAAAAHAAARLPDLRWDYRWMRFPAAGLDLRHPSDASLLTFRGHSVLQTLIRCYFSPAASTGQRFVYTGSHDGGVRLFDVGTGACAACFEAGACVRDLCWHPELPLLAAATWDGTVLAWDRRAGGPLRFAGGAAREGRAR